MPPVDRELILNALVVAGAYVLVGIPLILLTIYLATRAYHAGREASWMRLLERLKRRKTG